jgi:hypothetical protein
MSDKTPTAKEFANKAFDSIHNNTSSLDDLAESFREFAKLHVEAALKAANQQVKLKRDITKEGWPQEFDVEIILVDKESILSAYPLTNIR